jgi:hypothetical protein
MTTISSKFKSTIHQAKAKSKMNNVSFRQNNTLTIKKQANILQKCHMIEIETAVLQEKAILYREKGQEYHKARTKISRIQNRKKVPSMNSKNTK